MVDTKTAIIKSGGKQYIVKAGDEIYVDRIDKADKETVELEALCVFDDKEHLQLGTPYIESKVKAEVMEQVKGEKLRVAHFKAKVRYRKVRGFRAQMTKLKIVKI